MLNLNNMVTLNGGAGGAPELRKTTSGRDVANFSVATQPSSSRKDPNTGEWLDKPSTWHRIVAWGPTALYVHNNLKKGSRVQLCGHIVNRKWTKKVKVGSKTVDVEMESSEIHVDQISITNRDRSGRDSDAPAHDAETGELADA